MSIQQRCACGGVTTKQITAKGSQVLFCNKCGYKTNLYVLRNTPLTKVAKQSNKQMLFEDRLIRSIIVGLIFACSLIYFCLLFYCF